MLELLDLPQARSGINLFLNASPQSSRRLVPSSQSRAGALCSYEASEGRLYGASQRRTGALVLKASRDGFCNSTEQRNTGYLSPRATRIAPAHAAYTRKQTRISAMSERVSGLEAPSLLGDNFQLKDATAAVVEAATESGNGTSGGSLGHQPERYRVLEALLQGSVGRCGVIDGGLATELERRGADINDPLWSAKCLLEDKSADLVRQVHVDYYKSGADVSISASYQATIQGFVSRGFSEEKAESLLSRSVRLVVEARDQFWEQHQSQLGKQAVPPIQPGTQPGNHFAGGMKLHGGRGARHKPLVAASVGSYGAYLADGSEYSGEYGPEMTLERLVEFHRRRVQVLAAAGPDILAFETIPSLLEAKALVRLLEEEDLGVPAWISFNSKDGSNVVRGDPFEECVAAADACQHVVAVGINCTPPRFIQGLILAARKVSEKPLVVYPNSGEMWDAKRKEWVEATGVTDDDFTSFAPQWVEAGASLIGGCCRTTPHTISCIRSALKL